MDILNNLISQRGKVNKKKDKLFDLYADETISKEEFKQKNDEYTVELSKINAKIQEQEFASQEIHSKKERLLKIKDTLEIDLSSKEGISDEIISDIVKEVIVYPDSIEVILDGNFNQSPPPNNKYNNVSTAGQDGYPYRGIACQVQGSGQQQYRRAVSRNKGTGRGCKARAA
jgi:hypothetical protein